MGGVDILFNCAGFVHAGTLLTTTDADFDFSFNLNVKSAYRVIRSFLPAMIARGSGVIVNFSSGWGRATDSGVAPYCASKWALEGMSKSFALDLAPLSGRPPLEPGDTAVVRAMFGIVDLERAGDQAAHAGQQRRRPDQRGRVEAAMRGIRLNTGSTHDVNDGLVGRRILARRRNNTVEVFADHGQGA